MGSRIGTLILLTVAGALALAAVSRGRLGTNSADTVATIELPLRVAPSPPAKNEPPSLPTTAHTLKPIRFRITTTVRRERQLLSRVRQIVTRTVDRLQLVPEQATVEWVFERNPLDPRRVAGYRIEHGSRRIVAHQETDLLVSEKLRGWADVLMMRFDPTQLVRMRRTGESVSQGGASFFRYVAVDASPGETIEVWWSEELLLASKLVIRHPQGLVTASLDRIEPATNTELLRDPRARLRDYDVVDFSDVREGHSIRH